MICPGCGYNNKPGRKTCSICTAPLFKVALLENVPRNVLLQTDKKMNKLYFYIIIILILLFFYMIFKFIFKLKVAIEEQEQSQIAYQILQRKVKMKDLPSY